MPRTSANGRGLATNLFLQSGPMTVAPWSATNMTATGGQTDPFGGTDATLWTESTDGGAANHFANQPTTALVVAGGWQLVSWYAKASSRSFSGIRVGNNIATAIFDLSTFAVTLGGTSSGNINNTYIEDVGNGWRRIGVVCRSYGTGNADAPRIYACSSASGLTYTGSGLTAIYTFGAMVESPLFDQTTPSPYIATTSTTASGQREWRQNLIRYSATVSNAAWTKQAGVVVTDGQSDPWGGTTATKLDLTAAAAGTGVYTSSFPDGVMFGMPKGNTKSVWLRGDVGGEVATLADSSLLGGVTTCNLTTQWQRFSLSESVQTGNAAIWVRKSSGNVIYMAGPQLTRGNTVTDFVATNVSRVNSSGAPRSVSGARTAAGARGAA